MLAQHSKRKKCKPSLKQEKLNCCSMQEAAAIQVAGGHCKKIHHSELKPQGEAKLVVCGFSGIGASISYAPHGTPESQQSSIDRFG